MVDWPGRGNRGKESTQTTIRRMRSQQEPKHNQSMTAVATEQAPFYDGFRSTGPTYTGNDAEPLQDLTVPDNSLTRAQHLALWDKRDTLLKRSNPFQMPDDIKRETSRKKIIKHDSDTDFKRKPRE